MLLSSEKVLSGIVTQHHHRACFDGQDWPNDNKLSSVISSHSWSHSLSANVPCSGRVPGRKWRETNNCHLKDAASRDYEVIEIGSFSHRFTYFSTSTYMRPTTYTDPSLCDALMPFEWQFLVLMGFSGLPLGILPGSQRQLDNGANAWQFGG